MNSGKVKVDGKLVFNLVSKELIDKQDKKIGNKTLKIYGEYIKLIIEKATLLAIEVCEANGETVLTEEHLMKIMPQLVDLG